MKTGRRSLLPDFMIIGRPKCGTTSLAAWLAAQPEVFFSRVKEPRFFIQETRWEQGTEWYSSLFQGASQGQVLGEATPGYTHPRLGPIAAERIASTVPDARLIYLVRHPVERLRSAYRHQRIVGDESEPLVEALRRPDNIYTAYSRYYACLAPYIDRFPRDQILVVRMEDVVAPHESGWKAVLDHIGLTARARPHTAYNVSAGKGLTTRLARRVLRAVDPDRRRAALPWGVRQLGQRFTQRRSKEFDRMLATSEMPIPDELLENVWNDIDRFEGWLGVKSMWSREGPTGRQAS